MVFITVQLPNNIIRFLIITKSRPNNLSVLLSFFFHIFSIQLAVNLVLFAGRIPNSTLFQRFIPCFDQIARAFLAFMIKIGRMNHQHIMAFSFSRHASKLSIVPFLFFLKAYLTCSYLSTFGRITQFTSYIQVASSILQFTSSMKLILLLEVEMMAGPSLLGPSKSSLSPVILLFLLRIIQSDQIAEEYKQNQREWKGHAIKG